jgi:hypothetical protein
MAEKILLWLDVFSQHFGMATYLQKKYNYEISAVIDVNRGKKFYEEQKFVDFKNIWYFRECFDKSQKKPDLQYLAEIEKKYKFDLWKIIYSDIHFYKYNEYYKFTYDEILVIIEQECKFFEKILDQTNPDFFAIRITDLSNGQILKKICVAKGIKVLMLGQTRFENRLTISEEYDYSEFSKKSDIKDEKSFKDLREAIEIISSSQSSFRKNFRNSKKIWIKGALKYLSLIINSEYRDYYSNYGKFLSKVIYLEGTFPLKLRYRKKFIDNNFSTNLDYNQNFIYFPLSLDPERSTLIPATFYTNQLEVITNIAKSLPIDFQLFVKEHPMQKILAWRNIEFYKEIMELPNVKLIHPSISQENILKHCKMLITIAGTSGLEAALYEKPSIVFSDVIYASLPSVYRLKNLEELPTAIRESLKVKVKLSDVNEFMNLVDSNSFEYDQPELIIKINREFFYDGYLFDTEINQEKAAIFLDENHKFFEILAEEHMKKIEELK